MLYEIGACRLDYLLEERNMTPSKLSEFTKIPEEAIRQYMNNEIIMSYEVAANIAYELDCKMDDLYEWIELV